MFINKKLLLYLIIFIYIFFLTPQIISDSFINIISGSIYYIYINQNKNLISFTFNHKKFDGVLASYYIKNNLVKYKNETNIKIYDYKSYQYLNNNTILHYTKFVSSISYLLKDMLKYQNRTIKIAIYVSIRNKLNNYFLKGNFIKFALCTLYPSYNLLDICSKIQFSIKNTQQSTYFKYNTTLYDIFSLYNIDYFFNNKRFSSVINTNNNNLLIKQSIHNILENDIFNLIHNKKKRMFINLEFINNKYIISHFINLDDILFQNFNFNHKLLFKT